MTSGHRSYLEHSSRAYLELSLVYRNVNSLRVRFDNKAFVMLIKTLFNMTPAELYQLDMFDSSVLYFEAFDEYD